MEPKIDKEFQDLIPPLLDHEFDQLKDNLISEGCRDPLITWNGVLLDGHNRLAICRENLIPYKTKEIAVQDRTSAKIWIIDNQEGRRNLSDLDRIALQDKRHQILKAKGEENLKTSTGGRNPRPLAKSPKAEKVNTRAECAAKAKVGQKTYDAGRKILEAAEKGIISKEVVQQVRESKKSIHRVAKEIKESEQRKKREEARSQASLGIKCDTGITVGDFREHASKISDGSLSLIFTDPPYDRKASKMLDGLGEFANAKLADGGSLICYVGQTQIPDALDALRRHLRYWWTIACIHAGGATIMREYGIKAGWKAVLWFVKNTRDDNQVMVSDVMSGGQEKSHHDWQQSESEAAYWIEKLCPKDGIVCDPFLGGGTTAVAAKRLGRKWVGFEIDEKTAKIASGRIAK